MRGILFALAVALAGCGFAQDLSKPVDYTTRAVPLRKALAALSTLSGAALVSTPELDEEPVVLRLEHVPLKDAMAKIAEAFAGEWVRRDKWLELRRADRATELHKEALHQRALRLKKGLEAALAAETYRGKPFDSAVAAKQVSKLTAFWSGELAFPQDYYEYLINSPIRRLQPEALALLDPEELAAIRPGQRVVYSTDPNPLERPLRGLEDAIQRFTEQEEILSDEIDRFGADPKVQKQLENTLGARLKASKAPVVTLEVMCDQRTGFNIRVTVLDDEDLIAGSFTGFGEIWPKMEPRPAPTGPEVTPGPIGQELKELMRPDGPKFGKPLRSGLRQALLSPASTDPLAWMASDLFLGLSEKHGVNAVILPTERSEVGAWQAFADGKTTLNTAQYIVRDMELTLAGGWLVGRPVDPLEAQQTRLPRVALENYVKSVASSGFVAVADGARLEAQAGPYTDHALVSRPSLILSLPRYPWRTPDDLRCLALIDSFGEESRRIDAASLTREQTAGLMDWALNLVDPVNPLGNGPQVLAAEVLGSGIPQGSYVEITTQAEAVVAAYPKNFDPLELPIRLSLNELARYVARRDDPTQPSDVNLDRLWSARRLHVNLRFVIAGKYVLRGSLSEDGPLSEQPIDLEAWIRSLPDSERAQYLQSLAAERKSQQFPSPEPSSPPAPPTR